MILLWKTAVLKNDAYLNLGDWKLSLENDPGHCLFAACNNLDWIIVSKVHAIFHSHKRLRDIRFSLILTRCGKRAFVWPIGRHRLVLTFSDCFSDKSSNIKCQLHSVRVWQVRGGSFYAMSFSGIFVNFQLVKCVMQAFEIQFMIIFKLVLFDFIQAHLGVDWSFWPFALWLALALCSWMVHFPNQVIDFLWVYRIKTYMKLRILNGRFLI